MEAHVITTLKLAGLSAMLSAGLVTGFSGQDQQLAPAVSGKVFYERVTDAPLAASIALASARGSLARVDVNVGAKSDLLRGPGEASPSRTSEVRTAANVSTLVRNGSARALAAR